MDIASLENQLRQTLLLVEPRAEFIASLGRQLRRGPSGPPADHQSVRWWWVLAGVGGAGLVFLGFRLLTALARRASGLPPAQPAHLRS